MSQHANVTPPVEVIPSQAGEISGIASAHAPFLYFDNTPTFGCQNGIVNITLEAVRHMAVGNTATNDRVVVAHLRMSIPAARALKAAIDGALLLAIPAASNDQDPTQAPASPKPH